jgi:hypothetical protein
MAEAQPKIEGLSVVLVGSFNPQIFQPAWFASEHLIRAEEAKTAKIEVIHSEITIFSLEWARVQVERGKFSIDTSSDQRYETGPLRDLVVSTFSLLRHTPVSMMGVNWYSHFEVSSEEAWHKVGDQLAPKEIWKDLLAGRPGMRSLLMEGQRSDGLKGYVRVKVEPSLKALPYGVFIQVNDHYGAQKEDKTQPANEFVEMLQNSWNASLEQAKKIAYTIIERTK